MDHYCAPQKNEPLITLERVTLRVGDKMLLPGTSWEIKSGENWAILGPNGSGKSALARAVKGDIPHVRGRLIRHDPEAEGRRIGYVSFELQEEILAREELRDEERSFSGRGHELTAGELLRENEADPAALDAARRNPGTSAPCSATASGPSPTARSGSS